MESRHFNARKLHELEEAVRDGRFPIIVYGPSGSGKTQAIKHVLARRRLKFFHVDLAETPQIRKPFLRQAVILTHLYEIADLERIVYRDRVIIESSLAHLNRVEGYTLVRFNVPTRREAARKRLAGSGVLAGFLRLKQSQYNLELYRFIGRIFYGKLKIGAVSIVEEYLQVELPPGGMLGDEHMLADRSAARPGRRLSSELPGESSESARSARKPRRRRLGLLESSDGSAGQACRPGHTSPACSEGGQSSFSPSDSCSFDDDLLLQPGPPKSTPPHDERVPRIMLDNMQPRAENEGHTVRFSRNKILGYLYENMLAFSSIETLPIFYDCFSLLDSHRDFAIPLVQSIVEKSRHPQGRYSFRSLDPRYYRLV